MSRQRWCGGTRQRWQLWGDELWSPSRDGLGGVHVSSVPVPVMAPRGFCRLLPSPPAQYALPSCWGGLGWAGKPGVKGLLLKLCSKPTRRRGTGRSTRSEHARNSLAQQSPPGFTSAAFPTAYPNLWGLS